MDFNWQDLSALSLVALAVACLAWRGWRVISAQPKAGCGSCGTCPSSAAANNEPNLVPLVVGPAKTMGPAERKPS